MLRRFCSAAFALLLAACTHNNYTPNVIRITPNGTQGNPATKPIDSSFTLLAVEDGYSSDFTADTIVGKCWVVQLPITTGGAWKVSPQGSTCDKHDVEQIQVKDQKGNSAVTYIRGVGTAGQ